MDFVEQLKSSVDIVSVIGEYVRLRRSGANRYMGLCPFHNEKSPSFTVHVVHQFYKCFSCGAGGDVVKFVMEKEGLSFYEALKSLSERYGIPMPKRSQYADEDSKLRGALLAMHELARGELPRQSEIAGRAKRRALHRQARPRAGDRGALRPGLLRPLGPRPGASLRAARIPRGADGRIRPGRQAAGRQPLRPLSQPADVSDSQRIGQDHRHSADARCRPTMSPST